MLFFHNVPQVNWMLST